MPRNLKSRTEPKDTIVSLPVRVWHQVETFDDGSEVCAIKHPNGATNRFESIVRYTD